MGLKENVIIGKLIPAGTGLSQFRVEDSFTDDGEPLPENAPAEAAGETDGGAVPEETVPLFEEEGLFYEEEGDHPSAG